MSTRVEGATILVMVTAHATLSAGPVHFSLSAREGPAPGTWRYNLTDGPDHRAAGGRVAGMTDHMDVLRYAAGISAAGYEPGTVERGLLEQFAAGDMGDDQKLGGHWGRIREWTARPSPSGLSRRDATGQVATQSPEANP